MTSTDWYSALLCALVVGLLCALWKIIFNRSTTSADASDQTKARASLKALESARDWDADLRHDMIEDLIKKGLIPGARPEHKQPEKFEDLVTHVRRVAYPMDR